MGQIIHGNKNFGFAPITTTGDTPSFGTPVMIPGLVSAEIEVDQEDTNIYADDVTFCVAKGAKVRTATVTLRNIPAAYVPLLGFVAQANGGFADTGTFANHCIFFETGGENCEDGTTSRRLHFLYSVKASEPTMESSTDEEEVEAAEIEIEYTATESSIAKDANGNAVQYFYIDRTEENARLFDSFTTAVILPTSTNP